MTAEKIKIQALCLFAEQGYEGTALSQIAKGAGIKTPSIYAHFSSKQELFISILKDIVYKEMDLIRSLLDRIEPKDIETNLKSLFFHLTDLLGKGPELLFYKRAVFFPPRELSKAIKESIIHFESLSADFLKTAFHLGIQQNMLRELDADQIHSSFYCLLDGLFFEHHLYEEEEFLRRRELVWSFFWNSIKRT